MIIIIITTIKGEGGFAKWKIENGKWKMENEIFPCAFVLMLGG